MAADEMLFHANGQSWKSITAHRDMSLVAAGYHGQGARRKSGFSILIDFEATQSKGTFKENLRADKARISSVIGLMILQ